MVGVAVMIGPDVLGGMRANALAQGAVLGAALSYACAGLYGRRFTGMSPLVTAAGQVTATAIMMLPLTLIVNRPWTLPMPGVRTWLAIGGLGLFCTALAYVIYFRILRVAGATNLLLVTFLIPVSALILGNALLAERLEPRQFAGMALIALGLASIDGRPLDYLKKMLTHQSERLAGASSQYELWTRRS
jgi:drug/metabolite transporter (DMT)-like permease